MAKARKMTKVEDIREVRKLAANKVKVGDLMAFVNFAKVSSIPQSDVLYVSNVDGTGVRELEVRGRELIENGFSADQALEEKKVSRTMAIEIFVSSYNRPITVCWVKKDGAERVLRGRFVNTIPYEGRSYAEDLDKAENDRVREVDHRTLKYVIVEGVKYTVKA